MNMGSERKSTFSPRRLIDHYFLEQQNPYSKRRPVRMKVLTSVLGGVLVVFVLGVIFWGGTDEKTERAGKPDFGNLADATVLQSTSGTAIGQSENSRVGATSFSNLYGFGSSARGASSQSRSANQVIRRGEGGNDPTSALPLGSTIPVRLVNAILSTNSASPVIAEVTQDVYVHGYLSVPAGTRAIGGAHFDEASRRIQLRFQNLVYPEGDQHQIQAAGMMPDGSAGVAGELHSGEEKRQFGRILGSLVGGVADGMIERQTGGALGIPYEPGSIKNGILSGVTRTAQDQTKEWAEDLGRTKPYMTLQAGEPLVLFLEKEYVP